MEQSGHMARLDRRSRTRPAGPLSPHQADAVLYLEEGADSLRRGDTDRALQALNRAVEHDPAAVDAWIDLGRLHNQLGSLDANEPRAQAAQLTGPGARAIAAQDNMWEGLVVFACAVFVNHLKGDADPGLSATLAQVFVLARVVHPAAYIGGIAALRSVAFLVGFVCCIWLFLA